MIGGVKDNKELKSYQVLHFEPFDPVHKRTEATVKGGDGKQFFVAKGAPQVILEMSKNASDVKPAVEKAVNDFAGRGFRSLGVARADEEGNWQFAGVLPMFDPPREQAKATIASAEQMGVKVKMVTGDQLAIARETAKQLGMGTNILDASSLQDKKQQDDAQSSEAIEKADGYAQVFPEDKFHIIQVLQKRGHFVGMTGDGVNDAPALKQADCGIAVSGATDAARAAASIVLLAPGLSVIIDAIKESSQDCPADEQLCDLPHRRNIARAVVHGSGDPGIQLLSSDRGDDCADCGAQRRGHPVDCVRQRSLQERARSLEHAAGAGNRHSTGHSSARLPRSDCSTWATVSCTLAIRNCRR